MFDLSKKEITWRKTWLVFLVVSLVYDFLRPVFQGHYPLNYLGAVAVSLIGGYILYHCAYKKPGTRLLMVALALAPFSLVGEMWAVTTFHSGFSAIRVVLLLLWAFLCFQLRRINRKLQLQKFLASEAYNKAIASLRSAETLEELEERFKEALSKRPRFFSAAISGEYLAKKSALLGQESPG